MQQITQAFLDELESQGLKQGGIQEADNRDIVTCRVHGKISDYTILFIFTAEHDVEIAAMRLAVCPENKRAALYAVANDFNSKCRWLKLVVMPDGSVNMRADSIVSQETSGAICVETFLRSMPMIEDVLPKINKAIWG